MKSNASNQTDKKQKKVQSKIDQKQKEGKLDSINNKENQQLKSNQKQKKNQNSIDYSSISSQKNNDKIKSGIVSPKGDTRKIYSISQEKNRNNIRTNSTIKNTKKPRNLSMDKNINTSQNNIIYSNIKTKKKKPKSEKKEEPTKINPLLTQNYDPNLYGFNLYKHIKENLRNKDRLCKDKLTNESLYCIECKLSTCKKCLLHHIHKGHELVPKHLYYNSNNDYDKIFNDTFYDIDSFLNEIPDYLDNKKLKEGLKQTITDNFDKLIKRLNEIKKKKFKELDKLFAETDGCIDSLNEKKNKIKSDIRQYMDNYKDFYFISVKNEEEDANKENDPNLDILKNFKNTNTSYHNDLMVQANNDIYNSIFLINYDIFKNTSYINNEICKLLNDIKDNKNKYLNEFNENINQINEELDKLSKPFNGLFNFTYLTNEFYKMVSDKLVKFSEKIGAMKKYIFDMVNKDGGFDTIDKDNKVSETTIKQSFENILNYQFKDKDDSMTEKIRNSRANKNTHRLSMYVNAGLSALKLKNTLEALNNAGSDNDNNNNKNLDGKSHSIYGSPDEIKLDKEVLQKYFAYETYNTIHNHFRYKKPKSEEEIIEELEDEIDIARPIPGTNEMLLYDRKTTNLIKKLVNFDKKKHKYLYFLNGCRSVLVKDMLYILGGVDKEKNVTKIAYVYYIKTNILKVMPEMLKPHAYHSVEFLEYYKVIIVIGGENSSACEIYDLTTGLWRELPDLNIPRAHCNLYLDKFSHIIYTFFGVVGDITEKNNYTDVIECLELKRIALGWNTLDYKNKAEMDFKSGYNKILPLSSEMILIYGANNMRDFIKKAAIYLIPKIEIVKIDNKIFKEIKEKSKSSRKLEKILSTYL